MKNADCVEIDATGMEFRCLNSLIRAELDRNVNLIRVTGVLGQRYIGAGIDTDTEIVIDGVPGNDLACFMSRAKITVNGNAQDGIANTMSNGELIIHGDVGDVPGYSMRGGRALIKGNAGYRAGIHMKAFKERAPTMIIGGTTADYLGEYMAGGMLVVLGMNSKKGNPLTGDFLGVGMHGGEIFVNGCIPAEYLGAEIGPAEINDDAWRRLSANLKYFCNEFGINPGTFKRSSFTRLVPVTVRPYGKLYVY